MDVDAQDYACNTTLHHASSLGKLSICRYLVEEQKVDVKVKNSELKLAIDLA